MFFQMRHLRYWRFNPSQIPEPYEVFRSIEEKDGEVIYLEFESHFGSLRRWIYLETVLGIPVAGATLPVMAFMLLAVYGKNVILGAAVIILGIGHIGIHLMHRKDA